MTNTTKLRIVIFQEGEWLCAHCLEYDFATQAKSLADLRYDLERMIVGHIAISLKHGLRPFRNARRAPRKFWMLFQSVEDLTPARELWSRHQEAGSEDPDA